MGFFKFFNELQVFGKGDDGGVWLLFWMDVWIYNIEVTCELVGGGGDTLGGGDICELG
jgi:hypothetical protein